MSCAAKGAEGLGVDELGPYAFEPCMPARVRARLREDGERNVVRAVIPKLKDLLSNDLAVAAARLCRSDTHLIHKLAREGETFCGYRNLQMLLHSIDRQSQWHTIFDIQDKIEKAWDAGHNAEGRAQTGGIRNTRKFIGTPEVEAVLQAQGVQCQGSSLEGEDAAHALCTLVAAYYGLSTGSGVQATEQYPIFLQKPGHSVLIVGAAKLKDDSANGSPTRCGECFRRAHSLAI